MNFIDAAASGAGSSISLIANVLTNLIAFFAILTFVNATLTWFGHRVGVEELTLEVTAVSNPIRFTRLSELKLPVLHRRDAYTLHCLGDAVVGRRTRDRKVAGSTSARGAIKSTRSTQPSMPPG